ncbi:hypothetical protein CAOG_01440 [Capsaspora owczarzaki ATCC 30864]|uniref:Uncharacterized protein n=1 Tax=Capsaspora owczarzaki (strain ATCC 30864) TaxID=595528 RepID=A0A0D2WJ92_CAPO3|nr:hypothetical protein CAOG_01440 [Capsaspora owczarzaki ATCC 30864]KJE90065.1 hypothetical protein CAOG_001440 [Capsaspora owczarzaki ATCC 30864]|eukprot:XP_004364308.1 hypothetical protein CAOG_01440 [Capsaspora owczarzaki ATCC 30864]
MSQFAGGGGQQPSLRAGARLRTAAAAPTTRQPPVLLPHDRSRSPGMHGSRLRRESLRAGHHDSSANDHHASHHRNGRDDDDDDDEDDDDDDDSNDSDDADDDGDDDDDNEMGRLHQSHSASDDDDNDERQPHRSGRARTTPMSTATPLLGSSTTPATESAAAAAATAGASNHHGAAALSGARNPRWTADMNLRRNVARQQAREVRNDGCQQLASLFTAIKGSLPPGEPDGPALLKSFLALIPEGGMYLDAVRHQKSYRGVVESIRQAHNAANKADKAYRDYWLAFVAPHFGRRELKSLGFHFGTDQLVRARTLANAGSAHQPTPSTQVPPPHTHTTSSQAAPNSSLSLHPAKAVVPIASVESLTHMQLCLSTFLMQHSYDPEEEHPWHETDAGEPATSRSRQPAQTVREPLPWESNPPSHSAVESARAPNTSEDAARDHNEDDDDDLPAGSEQRRLATSRSREGDDASVLETQEQRRQAQQRRLQAQHRRLPSVSLEQWRPDELMQQQPQVVSTVADRNAITLPWHPDASASSFAAGAASSGFHHHHQADRIRILNDSVTELYRQFSLKHPEITLSAAHFRSRIPDNFRQSRRAKLCFHCRRRLVLLERQLTESCQASCQKRAPKPSRPRPERTQQQRRPSAYVNDHQHMATQTSVPAAVARFTPTDAARFNSASVASVGGGAPGTIAPSIFTTTSAISSAGMSTRPASPHTLMHDFLPSHPQHQQLHQQPHQQHQQLHHVQLQQHQTQLQQQLQPQHLQQSQRTPDRSTAAPASATGQPTQGHLTPHRSQQTPQRPAYSPLHRAPSQSQPQQSALVANLGLQASPHRARQQPAAPSSAGFVTTSRLLDMPAFPDEMLMTPAAPRQQPGRDNVNGGLALPTMTPRSNTSSLLFGAAFTTPNSQLDSLLANTPSAWGLTPNTAAAIRQTLPSPLVFPPASAPPNHASTASRQSSSTTLARKRARQSQNEDDDDDENAF